MIVPIDSVIPLSDSSRYATKKMKTVLLRQGQIEPIQVRNMDGRFVVFPCDVHGADIVYAARELGWHTLLVVEMAKYEE